MLRRASASFAAQLWSLVVSLADRMLLVGILIRYWGTDTYGDWATLIAAAGLLSMGEFGLNIYFGNNWQKAHIQGDEEKFQRFISISLATYIILGIALTIITLLIAFVGVPATGLTFKAFETDSVLFLFLVLAGANISRVMRGSISQIYRGRGRFEISILISSLSTVATIILVSTSAIAGGGVVAAAIAYLAADIIFGWGVLLFDLKRRYPHLTFRPVRPTNDELSDIFRLGKWYGLLQGTPVVWLQVPVLMIGSLGLGGIALVSFVVTRTLTNFARQIAEMLARSVGVEAANMLHLDKKAELVGTLSSFGRFASGLSGAIVGGLMIFGASVIFFWTGKPQLFSPWLLFWFLAPSVLVAPAILTKMLFEFGNVPKIIGIVNLLQMFVGLSLGYALAQFYGIPGLVAGLAIGEALAQGVVLPVFCQRHFGLNYLRYLLLCVSIFAVAAIWSGLIAWSILALVGVESLVTFLTGGLLWGMLGFLPVVILAIPGRQRARLFEASRSWARGN